MKVFITGGTGFVGRKLAEALASKGHGVTVLTRRGSAAGSPEGVDFLKGDPNGPGEWQDVASGHDAIVNLAGRSIFSRWTPEVKRDIRGSRLRITRNVVEALTRRRGERASLLNASAVGYYGFTGDEVLEEGSPPGSDFLASVARDWEGAAMEAREGGARVALCRFGIVLGRGGGALAQMLKTYKRLPVAPLGGGKQWFSWIHQVDLVACLMFVLEHSDIEGPVNCTSPGPVRNRELVRVLADLMGRRVLPIGVPGFALGIALGEVGSVLIEGQRVVPHRLLEAGLEFTFPGIRDALADLLGPLPGGGGPVARMKEAG